MRTHLLVSVTALFIAASPVRAASADASHSPNHQQALELLSAICPNSIQADRLIMPQHLGCKPCPVFTTVGGLSGTHHDAFGLEKVIYGSFTKSGVQQAVGGFEGCENHATTPNFRSSILFTKGQRGWRMVSYARGVDTSGCQTYGVGSERQILLCQSFSGHPLISGNWVFAYDFAAPEKERAQDLFGTVSTWGACGNTAVIGAVTNFQIHPLKGEEMPVVSVRATAIKIGHSGKLGVCAEDTSQLQPKGYRIDFIFKNGRFEVAPWSAATKKFLDDLFAKATKIAFDN